MYIITISEDYNYYDILDEYIEDESLIDEIAKKYGLKFISRRDKEIKYEKTVIELGSETTYDVTFIKKIKLNLDDRLNIPGR